VVARPGADTSPQYSAPLLHHGFTDASCLRIRGAKSLCEYRKHIKRNIGLNGVSKPFIGQGCSQRFIKNATADPNEVFFYRLFEIE
jgi:hypothetical protein